MLVMTKIYKLILFLIFLCAISACRLSGKPSEKQIERAKLIVSEIGAALYTPGDVELLEEILNYGSNPEFYPGCVSGHIYVAYRSPKPFDEVLDEYRIGLPGGQWEPSPGYPHDLEDVDFFRSGTQAMLTIASSPIREDILIVPASISPKEQQETIYYIQLLYYEPSISECSEM